MEICRGFDAVKTLALENFMNNVWHAVNMSTIGGATHAVFRLHDPCM